MISADVMHQASGAEGRPSFTAVSSIDLMASKHIALSRVQAGSQEIINNLEEMIVTIPCLHLHFISSLLAIRFLFSSNPLLAFLLISSSIFRPSITQLSITQLFIIQPFYYSALYYSAFSLFSSITQRHFY